MSSYRSSYKSSSYRISNTDGTSNSRLSRASDDADSYSLQYSTRRTFNYDDGPGSSSYTEDLTSRPSRASVRLSSRFSTESETDAEPSASRFSSKYKSLLSDNDDYSLGRLGRYSSREESDSLASPSTRLSRYSSVEGDDDLTYSGSSTRRQTRLSYLDEDEADSRRQSSLSSYTRRYTSDLKDSLNDYKVTTPTEEEARYSFLSSADSGDEYVSKRRFQSDSSRTLSRLDSKDAGQVYEAILDYEPPRSATDEICLKEGQEVVVLSKDRPHKWKVRTRRSKLCPKVEEGFAPSAYLKAKNETVDLELGDVAEEPKKDELTTQKDLKKKKDMIVRELIETEEDLIRDMQFVQRTYIRQSESSITPKEIKAVKEDIFNCFKELLSFHNDVLLKNFQTLSKEPSRIGAIFLKLQSDFDNHTKYCQNLPKALAILDENSDVSEFFNNYSTKIRDEKSLSDHLKLPFQRISDYQLLLKELSKHLSRMEENVDDLERAIKVIATIPEAKPDLDEQPEEQSLDQQKQEEEPFPRPSSGESSAEPTDRLSKMLKNVLQAKDYFDVIENNGKAEERFIFLFKTRMFITEINKNISENQRTYSVKKIVKLPEVEIAPDEKNSSILMIRSKDLHDKSFPIALRCKSQDQANTWMEYINRSPKEEDKAEQSLLAESSLFVNAPEERQDKLDENNNKIKAALAKVAAEQAQLATQDLSSASATSTASGVDGSSKTSAGNASADLLDENNTEATTAASDNLRTESLSTSVDAAESKISTTSSAAEQIARSTEIGGTGLRIVQPLKAVTRHVGESALFECQVSSTNLNVQWLKDNKILSGSNYQTSKSKDTYYLELSALTPEDAGLYTFVASNAKESTSSSSTLNVLSALGDSRPTSPGGSFLPHAPKFKVKLKDTELLEGTTVRFELIVRGLPIPNISILKDGKPLQEDAHLKVLFQSKEVFEIMIEHVKAEDAGLYKCIAVNSEGRDETSGRISVSSDKNVFWGLDEAETSTLPEDILSPRSRSPAFKWFKDGQEFEASERFQVQFDDQEDNIVLVFQHVKPDDAGIYTCVASTSSGKISCSAELNVQGFVRELSREPLAPEVKKELTSINITEGESVAILEAQISGYPKPKITWFKGAEMVQADEHVKMLYEGDENYALVIKNVKDVDAGTYRLEAANELGSAQTSAELTVLKKPKFAQIDDTVEVMLNDKLVIEAKYEAAPAAKVMWTKDGVEIKDSKRIKSVVEKDKCQLVVGKATSEDAGTYKCMIANDLGKAERDVNVLVNSPPKILKRLEAVQVWEGETATFTVQCSAVPMAQIEFYKEAKRVEASERIKITEGENGLFELKIDKTTPEDQGKYKCVLKNKYGTDEDSAELTINKKKALPEFKDQLKDVEAKVDDQNVKLQVCVDGEPKPAVKWFHNGEEIKEGQKGVSIINDEKGSALVISKVTPEDHGLYVCKAENACGQVQTSGNLIVKGPPYVVKHLENAEVAPDTDVTLTAIIKGNPTPQVKWYHGEKEIKLDKRKSYNYDEASAEYTLKIAKLIPEDVGMYRIEAVNEYGKCNSSAKLDIASKPLFTKVLKNIVCKEMTSNVEMVVQLDKLSTQPLVQWFKDDKEILDGSKNIKKIHDKLDNTYKLVVLKATEEMVGKYKCVASNDFGSTETAARFDIISKPKFIKGLENLQVLEGDHVSMTVQISGFPKPEVTFYKDGQDVSAEATIVVKKEMDDIYVLEIENIRIIMSGEYECRIRNEAGEASSTGLVTVNGKPKFLKDLTDINVNAGEDVSLEVVITGKPAPEVKWFLNGKQTPGTERILLDAREELYALKIPNAVESDTGVYHCVASNDFGKSTSEKSNVKVVKHEFAPVFKKHIEDAIVVVDDNVRFEAQVSASPAAEVIWSKDGIVLKPSEKVIITRDGDVHVLILKDLKLADSGVISCKAQNAKGFNTDTAKLTVQEPTLPTISGLSHLSVVDGEPLKVEAVVTGFPKPIVNWYLEGEYVDAQLVHSEPHNQRYLLNFKSFTSDLAGKYTCSAVNCAGEAVENFNIDICGKKPVFVKELEESIVMSVGKGENNKPKIGQSAIFETIVFGIPTPTVTWLKNGKELSPNNRVTINSEDDEHRLEIKEVTKDDVAQYTCKATNIYGEALSICLLKFLNEPHAPIIKKPLEDVRLEEGETLQLLCKVDGEPMPAVRWLKNDSPLDQDDRVKISSKGDGSTSLTIDSSVLADSGQYQVQAENAKGTAACQAKVLVEKPQRPPKFIKPLIDKIKVEFNCPLILQAVVHGLPPPCIEWIKDGKPINKATTPQAKTIVDDKGECQLKIEHAKSDDAGNYAIKATNANGEALSATSVQVMPEPFAPLVLENLPVKVQVVKGEPINLHAKISAYPLPKVTWHKDRKPLEEGEASQVIVKPDGNLSLIIDSAKLDDTGLYSLTVENTVGEISISTQVNVLSPAEAAKTFISKSLPEKVDLVEAKEPLILTAKIDGVKPKEVTWVKDGKAIKSTDEPVRISQKDNEFSLSIQQPSLADSGVYALVVKTPEGDKLQTQTDVKVSPQRTHICKSLPQKVEIAEAKEPLVLTAKLEGAKPKEVAWVKDGKPIKPADDARVTEKDGEYSLNIEKPKLADSGVYALIVKTPEGEQMQTQTEVKVSPAEAHKAHFSKPLPDKVELREGKEPLLLTAKLDGPVPKEVTWTKDGTVIKPTDETKMTAKNGEYSLNLEKPVPTDSGVYALEVKTADGEKLQTVSEVKVSPLDAHKTYISKPLPSNIEVVEAKEPLVLIAKVEGPSPKETSWLKDGQAINSGPDTHIAEKGGEHSLSIEKPKLSDSGVYAIVMRTLDGSKLQSQSDVHVRKAQGPFQVVQCLPAELTVKPGEDIILSMKVDSANVLPSEVQVFKDDRPLTAQDGAKVTTSDSGQVQLSQAKCSAQDSGLYRIEIKTPDGNLSNSCLVQVIDKSADDEAAKKEAGPPPKFTRELVSVEVESGNPCRLECGIEGNPNDFAISWFKDGEEIVPGEHYGFVKAPDGTLALLIDSFSSKDAAQYSVRVKNAAGQISSSGKATLKSDANKTKPSLIEQLSPVSVQERAPIILKAKVISSAPFETKWLHNNQVLKGSDEVKFVNLPDGTVMLQIDNSTLGDAGEYKLEVKNDYGKSSSETTVAVQAKPLKPLTVLQGLTPVTLIAGQTGYLEMQVDSDGEGQIKFLQDGKQVQPNDRVHIQQLPDGVIRLTFDKVLLDDQGEYSVLFENDNGQVQSSCSVTVKSKPIISKHLRDLTVKEGCAAKFEVEIKANPAPSVSWRKSGLDLSADSRQVTMLEGKNGTYFLILDKCNFRDEAEYSVFAVNDLGEDTSCAKLSVIATEKFDECAPSFLQGLTNITLKKGDPFTLVAKIKAHPVPEIVWKKDGKPISRSDNVLIDFDGITARLTVSSADTADFGTYELCVGNSLGQISSKASVTCLMESAPRFVKKLTDMEANVKIESKLTCRVEANPEAEVFWLFNGKAIEPSLKYSIFKELDEQVLIVFNPTEIDSGNYECRAQNYLGCDRTEATVHFIEKDKKGEAAAFLTKLADYDVLEGGTARFTACVIGNPRAELSWFKDGQEIKIDNDKYWVEYKDNGMIRFEVRNVTSADLGKYRCHASNIYGYDNSIAQLNLETIDGLDRADKTHKSQKSQNRALGADDIDYRASGLPVPLPDTPKITKMSDNSLTLIWLPSVPEQPRFPVSYVVEFGKLTDGVWMIYQTDIKDTKCEVTDLKPFEDYSFRIRVENKFGISDPSPSVTAFRSKLKADREPKEFKPTDYEIAHMPREKIAAAPKFLREEESSMYGICGQPVTIEFWVYGYPEPNITWFFENEKIEHSSRFNFMQDRNGKVCLFIDKMDLSDVGYFTCLAKNEHGEEKKTIKLMPAEAPVFTKRLEETTVQCRNHIRLDCSFKATPEVHTIKWFKDFQPLHDTSRLSIINTSDQSSLTISDCITRDLGLYSCTVTNLAGSTTTAAFVHVTDSDVSYSKYPFSYNKTIKPQNKSMEQFFDLGDELGRGTQGVVYHAVERSSGKSYAAKMMHGMGETKQFMMAELEAMNQLGTHDKLVQLRDAFAATPYSLSLITDMCGGGSLLDFILKKNQLTENEVAQYIRQILEGLHYMHFKNVGHFGLTIGDILMERINGPDIKICDFGLAQRVVPGMRHYVEYGHPEFVSPEIVSKNNVTFGTDVWSAGIITYILLTGTSPFLSENDRATLQNIQNKKLDLSHDTLKHISESGQDFLRKVLDYDPRNRLDVKGALNHAWLKLANRPEEGTQLNVLDKLREYRTRYNKWYDNASCKRYYRRRGLHSCYTHPSRMIYPPDEQYSPLVSPDREIKKYTKTISPFENVHPPNLYGSENFQSESHYQSGPDTYLLQLRDTDFPARIRRYLRIAATSSPSINYSLKQSHWGGMPTTAITGHIPQVSIKERRKFTDVMDEEIHDEMRGFTNRSKPMRLVRELGTSSYAYGQLSTLRKEAKSGHAEPDDLNLKKPFFREKLKDETYKSGDDIVFSCYAVGQPEPAYTWFRNDSILIESSRVEVKRTSDGRCQLRLKPAREYDVGVYKCVARNSQGSVTCRARLSLGYVPENLSPPCIKDGSADSVLLAWRTPRFVGNSYVKYYRLESRRAEEEEWRTVDSSIKQEYYLVSDLQPDTNYYFRLSAYNKFGWSASSAPSELAKTLSLEENKTIAIPSTMQFVCSPTAINEGIEDQLIPDLDYSRETNPVPLIKSEFKDLYDFKSIILKGKFSVISRAYIKDGSRSTLACKCILSQCETEASAGNEYEIMKSLVNEKIVKLCYANKDSNVFTLATELLSGLNVLTYLSRKQFYTEECVSKIICQVLDAIEYLHYRGLALIELQPDNVLVADERSLQIKLTDFANVRHVTAEGSKISVTASAEFIAPELIKNEEVTLPYTDIWSVGVLTYILLSGHSPFKGEDPKETAQNVVYVRYLFDRLYPEVTQEAIRFILTVFKLTPHKRPTIDECLESKWLLPNEFMIRKRQLANFSSNRLKVFSDEFFSQKESSHSRLLDLLGLNE